MASESQSNSEIPEAWEAEQVHGEDTGSEPAESSSSVPSSRPWGPWASIGWTLLCLAVMFAAQIVVLVVFVAVRVAGNAKARLDDLATNGNVLGVATIASTFAVVGLIALLISVRHYPIREYLALSWPSVPKVFIALGGLVFLLVASDTTSYLLGRPIVPQFMIDVYRTAWLPLLLLVLLVLAPLSEEVLMRGFLYKGIASSRWGVAAAIVVSAVLWSVVHVQYDWYGIASVAVLGLYLGAVRFKTASVLVTMLLHSVANAGATAEVVILEKWLK